tara:strand:- start:238 stop:444 length:207 start_codon:yes stop_codon:yes gene_type:complete
LRLGLLLVFVEVKFRANSDATAYAMSPARARADLLRETPWYVDHVRRSDLFVVAAMGRFQRKKNFWRP